MRRLVSTSVLAAMLAGCATLDTSGTQVLRSDATAGQVAPGGGAPAPDTMRWLYGSGEAAGISIQAYRMLADYAIRTAQARPRVSVPLGLPDAAGGIATTDCAGKPPAVVFDVDETVMLNRGYEYWQAWSGRGYVSGEWDQWARNGAPYVAAVPGAVTGLRRLREAGIAVIFNTNRQADTAAGTAQAIVTAGLGPAVHGETLFFNGDDAMGSRKDGRRRTIAARYCVIALAGDNLGDFADVFNLPETGIQARRAMAARGPYAQLWGAGWFALPNPVYGAAIKGTVDDVFPPDARWRPAGAGEGSGQ